MDDSDGIRRMKMLINPDRTSLEADRVAEEDLKVKRIGRVMRIR